MFRKKRLKMWVLTLALLASPAVRSASAVSLCGARILRFGKRTPTRPVSEWHGAAAEQWQSADGLCSIVNPLSFQDSPLQEIL